jgi:hypothetical protein
MERCTFFLDAHIVALTEYLAVGGDQGCAYWHSALIAALPGFVQGCFETGIF